MPDKKSKPAPKKRGRKPKKKTDTVVKPPPKKRGRKPKGGKIIKNKENIIKTQAVTSQNIILHLKCNSNQLTTANNINYNPDIQEPQSYSILNNNKINELQFEILTDTSSTSKVFEKNKKLKKDDNCKSKKKEEDVNIKQIWHKLDILSKNLRCNQVSDKSSACFWCTCDFDNPTIYIPKNYNNDYLEVYGCFCSPQCALSYLKNEQIDNSTKWERTALLNNVYSKIFNYTKNIKPAPSPYYTLDKFYGNLTIQEYRKLLTNDRVLMIVDKPMTKILPEIYEDNNEMPDIYSNDLYKKAKSTTSSTFRLKRSQEKKLKKNALTKNFNF